VGGREEEGGKDRESESERERGERARVRKERERERERVREEERKRREDKMRGLRQNKANNRVRKKDDLRRRSRACVCIYV